jgi:hypothetical protein
MERDMPKMQGFFRRGTLPLYVTGGRVGCPRLGDADIEQCMTCQFLEDLDESNDRITAYCGWRTSETDRAGTTDTWAKSS